MWNLCFCSVAKNLIKCKRVSCRKLFVKSSFSMSGKKPFQRLPTDVIPSLYEITLTPNLEAFTFKGEEDITVKIVNSTKKIILNSADLAITKANLYLLEYERHCVPAVSILKDEEKMILEFVHPLPAATDAKLHIEFNGVLNDKLKGFYRSKYTSAVGEEENYCAVTQFESTDARRCFPCWDEPAIKARFDITLIVDNDIKAAISNMPVKETSVFNDFKNRVAFERTPVMSTYLVAIVVGDFDYVEGKSSDGVLVRVYTPVGKKEQGRFALDVAIKVLPYYKEYFKVAYPLPKLDLVAISELSIGAMENWGLVTYREAYLLVDNSNTSAMTKQWVALIVGHEFAHQWFGNLVTMEWWTHLWLNEGYASFTEFLCVAHLFPEYDIWTQFVTDMHCRALELDALKSSHPIEVAVGHPSEVEEIFDDISYNKGASVIRMLHKYIGDDDFRKGMNLYLTRHQYKNTYTEDLWAALEEASSKPVRNVMSTWTKQMGFPVVTIEKSVQEENNTRRLVLSQSKFSMDQGNEVDDTLWLIPLSFSSSRIPDKECFSAVMDKKSMEVCIPNVEPNDWVKLNPGTVGFYRTKYSSDMLQQFLEPVKKRILPPLDRLGLLDDLFALVQNGQSRTVDALKFMQVMTEEDNYTVWSNIFACLDKLHSLLYSTDLVPKYLKFKLQLIKPISRKLGYKPVPNESHLNTLLRSLILNGLVRCEDEWFIDVAKKMFEEHCTGVNLIPADMRSVVYKAVILKGSREGFDMIIKLYRETDSQEEKDRLSRSFSTLVEEDLVEAALKFSVSEGMSIQNTVIIIVSCATSKVGRDITWQFVKENWEMMYEKYQGAFLLSRIVKYSTELYATEEAAIEVENFFANTKKAGVERAIHQAVETIRNNAAWLKRDENDIREFFQKF